MDVAEDLLISGLDQHIVDALRQRADRHGWTLTEEIRAILYREVQTMEDFWAEADIIRQELNAGSQVFSDSSELICKERDR